jgi:hypothetical protein
MANIKTCYLNILENSTVSLDAGTAEALYPLYRLHDRLVGRIFKSTAAETITVRVDQGSESDDWLAVDSLLIASGHNLYADPTPANIAVDWSDNGSAWTPALTATAVSGTGVIYHTWTSSTHRYWRVVITSPPAAVEITELFLTQTYTFEKNPTQKVNALESQFNVRNEVDASGGDRFIQMGVKKERRNYRIELARAAQEANAEALNDEWGGYKPFFLYDHNDTWLYGKLNAPMNIEFMSATTYGFNFDFVEVIS